jgi:hypothetical protein
MRISSPKISYCPRYSREPFPLRRGNSDTTREADNPSDSSIPPSVLYLVAAEAELGVDIGDQFFRSHASLMPLSYTESPADPRNGTKKRVRKADP